MILIGWMLKIWLPKYEYLTGKELLPSNIESKSSQRKWIFSSCRSIWNQKRSRQEQGNRANLNFTFSKWTHTIDFEYVIASSEYISIVFNNNLCVFYNIGNTL